MVLDSWTHCMYDIIWLYVLALHASLFHEQKYCVLVLQSLKILDDEETTDSELRAKFNQRWNRTPSGDLYKSLRAGTCASTAFMHLADAFNKWALQCIRGKRGNSALSVCMFPAHDFGVASVIMLYQLSYRNPLLCSWWFSLSLLSLLSLQRGIIFAIYWTRQCRLIRWWKGVTMNIVGWLLCSASQRMRSVPPYRLPTLPRLCRAVRWAQCHYHQLKRFF